MVACDDVGQRPGPGEVAGVPRVPLQEAPGSAPQQEALPSPPHTRTSPAQGPSSAAGRQVAVCDVKLSFCDNIFRRRLLYYILLTPLTT